MLHCSQRLSTEIGTGRGGRGRVVREDGEGLHPEFRNFSLMGLSRDHEGQSGRSWLGMCGVLNPHQRGKLGSPQHTGFIWSHEMVKAQREWV